MTTAGEPVFHGEPMEKRGDRKGIFAGGYWCRSEAKPSEREAGILFSVTKVISSSSVFYLFFEPASIFIITKLCNPL